MKNSLGDLNNHGSSPLTRGTPDTLECPDVVCRFIPAHAGNTATPPPPCRWTAVHPRSRGEHTHNRYVHTGLSGSSPLTRGTPARRVRPFVLDRFIPAHAGNTSTALIAVRYRTVHPRSRGEHINEGVTTIPRAGSSPLTRGTLLLRGADGLIPRFIPAHAGNTCSRACSTASAPVHPRSRGEHSLLSDVRQWYAGSSPLTRGTHHPRLHRRSQLRFIPAHAGNTFSRMAGGGITPVHPRSRGEHENPMLIGISITGSSPLTRGTLQTHTGFLESLRFIPAHAGNTLLITC